MNNKKLKIWLIFFILAFFNHENTYACPPKIEGNASTQIKVNQNDKSSVDLNSCKRKIEDFNHEIFAMRNTFQEKIHDPELKLKFKNVPHLVACEAEKMNRPDIIHCLALVDPDELLKTNHSGYTALNHASAHGKTEIIKAYMEIFPSETIQAQGKHGKINVELAAGGGHVEAIQLLLKENPDLDQILDQRVFSNDSINEYNAIHWAAQERHLNVLEYFITIGATSHHLSIQSKDGRTPLHISAAGGNIEFTRRLISKLSVEDMNKKDSDGRTAYDTALSIRDSYKNEENIEQFKIYRKIAKILKLKIEKNSKI